MADYLDAAKEFHLVMAADPEDEIAVDWDGNTGYQTADLALDRAKELIEESGGSYMIYRCVPYKRVRRGPTTVTKFTARG